MTNFFNARDVAKRLADIEPKPKPGTARETAVRSAFNHLWGRKTKALTDFEILATVVSLEKTRGGKVWMAGLKDLIKALKDEKHEAETRAVFNALKVGDVFSFREGPDPTEPRTITEALTDGSFRYARDGATGFYITSHGFLKKGGYLISAAEPEPKSDAVAGSREVFKALKPGMVCRFTKPGPKLLDHVYIPEGKSFEVVSTSRFSFVIRYDNENLHGSFQIWVRRGGIVVSAEKADPTPAKTPDAVLKSDEEIKKQEDLEKAFDSLAVGDTFQFTTDAPSKSKLLSFVPFTVMENAGKYIFSIPENGGGSPIGFTRDYWIKRKGEILTKTLTVSEPQVTCDPEPGTVPTPNPFMELQVGDTVRFRKGYMNREPYALYKVEDVRTAPVAPCGVENYRVLRITSLDELPEIIHVAETGWNEYQGVKAAPETPGQPTGFIPTYFDLEDILKEIEGSAVSPAAKKILRELNFGVPPSLGVSGTCVSVPATAVLKELLTQLRTALIAEKKAGKSIIKVMGSIEALGAIPGVNDVSNEEIKKGLAYLSAKRTAFEMRPIGFGW